jgi:hypothetical protein
VHAVRSVTLSKYQFRYHDGEVNGEAVVHAACHEGHSNGIWRYTACGKAIDNLWFQVLNTNPVTCMTCLVKDAP